MDLSSVVTFSCGNCANSQRDISIRHWTRCCGEEVHNTVFYIDGNTRYRTEMCGSDPFITVIHKLADTQALGMTLQFCVNDYWCLGTRLVT